MAIIQMDTTLDVVNKYGELVKEALSEESVYARMKENLVDLLNDGAIANTDKARVISETVSNMAVALSSQIMDNAIRWAAQEKDLVLKKIELEYKLDLLKKESNKADADIDNAKEAKKLAQSKRLREYGTATLDLDGNVIGLTQDGLVYKQELLVGKQIEQAQANITKMSDDLLTATEQRLNIKAQTELHIRQKQGFDDNKYQKLFEAQLNAWGVMFSSGMMGDVKPSIIKDDRVTQLYNTLVTP